MLMSPFQKAGQKHGINIATIPFEDVSKFKYILYIINVYIILPPDLGPFAVNK
jgi:hypothetical protein